MHKIDAADEAQLFATIDRWIARDVAPREGIRPCR